MNRSKAGIISFAIILTLLVLFGTEFFEGVWSFPSFSPIPLMIIALVGTGIYATIKLGFPQLDSIQKYTTKGKAMDAGGVFKMINDCIEYIWEGDEIYKAKDATKKELNDFIESLSTGQFNKIRKYFESMPRLKHDITWTCPKCDKSAPLVLEGLDSFFG